MEETKSGERAGLACPPRAPAVALLPGLIQGCLPGSSRLGDGGGCGGRCSQCVRTCRDALRLPSLLAALLFVSEW